MAIQLQYTPIITKNVTVTPKQWHADGRGKLIVTATKDQLEFGQAYTTTVYPGIIKAWHYHKYQTDSMLLLRGTVRFGVITAPNLDHAVVELDLVVNDYEPMLITIPPGLYHGFANVGDEEAYILNLPDKVYNTSDPDEVREHPYAFSDFDWHINLHG